MEHQLQQKVRKGKKTFKAICDKKKLIIFSKGKLKFVRSEN
jgi:hypothetical protein